MEQKGRPAKRPKLDVSANMANSFLTADECRDCLAAVSEFGANCNIDAVWNAEASCHLQFRSHGKKVKKNEPDALKAEKMVYDLLKKHYDDCQQGVVMVHSAFSPCIGNPDNWNEVDLLVLSRSHGIIRVEVKSGPTPSDKNSTVTFESRPEEWSCPRLVYCHAGHQLYVQRTKRLLFLLDAAKIHNSNRHFAKVDSNKLEELIKNSPEIIALPLCKRDYLTKCHKSERKEEEKRQQVDEESEKKYECHCFKDKFDQKYRVNKKWCICAEEFKDQKSFSDWWKDRVESLPPQNQMNLETYRFLICWLALAPFVVSHKLLMTTVGASKYRIHNKAFQSIVTYFTRSQADLAKSTGTVWVRGAAGTGKTLVLQYVAKGIAQQIAEQKLPDKVLILTVNVPLAAALTHAFAHDNDLRKRGSKAKADVFSYKDREKLFEELSKASGSYRTLRIQGAHGKYEKKHKGAHIWIFPIKALLGMIYYENYKTSFADLSSCQQSDYMSKLCSGVHLRGNHRRKCLPDVGFRHIFWDETQNVQGPFCEFARWLQQGAEPSDGQHKLDRHLFLFNDPPYQESHVGHGISVEENMKRLEVKEDGLQTFHLNTVFRQTQNLHQFTDNYRKQLKDKDERDPDTVFPPTRNDGAWPEGPIPKFRPIERNRHVDGLQNPHRAATDVRSAIEEIVSIYKNDPWLKKKPANPTKAEQRVKELLACEICILTANEAAAGQLRFALNSMLHRNPVKSTHGFEISETVSAEEATSRKNYTVVVDSWRRFSGLDSVCVIIYDPPMDEFMPNPICPTRRCETNHRQRVEMMYYCAFTRATTLLYVLCTESAIDGFNSARDAFLPYKYMRSCIDRYADRY